MNDHEKFLVDKIELTSLDFDTDSNKQITRFAFKRKTPWYKWIIGISYAWEKLLVTDEGYFGDNFYNEYYYDQEFARKCHEALQYMVDRFYNKKS